MRDSRLRTTAALALVAGALLGMAGSFVPSASLRGVLWGLDGTALVVASGLLAVRCFRRGNDMAAAGFLVFIVGQTQILAGAGMELAASAPSFGAGAALWAAYALLCLPPFRRYPSWLGLGAVRGR